MINGLSEDEFYAHDELMSTLADIESDRED